MSLFSSLFPHQSHPVKHGLSCPLIDLAVFFVCVFINYKFADGIRNVYRMKITPPGYFFAIWGVIYTLTLGTLIAQIFGQQWTSDAHCWMCLVHLFNSGWILLTAHNPPYKVYLMSADLFLTALSVFNVWIRITPDLYDSPSTYYLQKNILAFYLGWVSCASILNLCMVLIYGLGYSQDRAATLFWPICLSLLGLESIYAIASGNIKGFGGFYLSAAWAIYGVTKGRI